MTRSATVVAFAFLLAACGNNVSCPDGRYENDAGYCVPLATDSGINSASVGDGSAQRAAAGSEAGPSSWIPVDRDAADELSDIDAQATDAQATDAQATDAATADVVDLGVADAANGGIEAGRIIAVGDDAADASVGSPPADAGPSCVPSVEICDGKDSDCDGTPDDGLTNACGGTVCSADLSRKGTACTAGEGDCQGSGKWECDPAAANNALRCTATEKSKNACSVSCAALDHAVGESCTNGGQNMCARSGKYVCLGATTVCDAPPAMPAPETCDGVDNDCDGMADEGLKNACNGCLPLTAQPQTACKAGSGACEVTGVFECAGTEAVACTAAAKSPVPEICDGADNDCDGQIDEEVKNLCGGCMVLPNVPGSACTAGVGGCNRPGAWICSGLDTVACNAVPGAPAAGESCDHVDNDCDGAIDEGVTNECGGCGLPYYKPQAVFPGQPCAYYWTEDNAGDCATIGVGACEGTDTVICNAPKPACAP